MEEATAAYQAQMAAHERARAYWTQRLGSQSKDSATYFRVGVVDQPLPGHEQYRGWLCIPYLTRSGPVGLKFRCLKDHDCKAVHKERYLIPAGQQQRPFNPAALDRPEPYLAVCEGEIDTITAHVSGIPAIGVPGASAWRDVYDLLVKGYRTVYLFTDNDDQGTGLEKFAQPLAERIPHARIILMPKGHDVNSFVAENGYAALREMVGLE